ncbi:ABC transporter ATP-binding protein [bacterium]|nr:ABC transporter ATP-binding protein [bacterium]
MIRSDDLTVRVGSFQLRGVSLEVARGQYAVLLGPTGCGKTVLLETLVGINRTERGSVWLDDTDVTDVPPERRGIGFVYQRSMLFPHLSVRHNVAYGLRYHGVARAHAAARVNEVAELVGIQPLLDRTVEALSGGETQKVALARALAIRPRVLLLDEPLGALDPVSKEALAGELRHLHRETGMTILHVTHDQQTARMLGRSIGVLEDGRLLQFGPNDEVFNRPNCAFVARFVGTENVFDGMATRDGEHLEIELGCGVVLGEGTVSGPVGCCVRPELIRLVMDDARATGGGGLNRVRGTVESVSDRGALVRYEVMTTPERFVVLQTKRDYAAGGAAVGVEVTMEFSPDDVHVFRRRGPSGQAGVARSARSSF